MFNSKYQGHPKTKKRGDEHSWRKFSMGRWENHFMLSEYSRSEWRRHRIQMTKEYQALSEPTFLSMYLKMFWISSKARNDIHSLSSHWEVSNRWLLRTIKLTGWREGNSLPPLDCLKTMFSSLQEQPPSPSLLNSPISEHKLKPDTSCPKAEMKGWHPEACQPSHISFRARSN